MNYGLGKKMHFTRVDAAFLICFASALLFLIIRVPYGFGIDDESLYISIPYRLVLGESLISDEWHVSQLSAFLLYLPVKFYVFLKGSTDGIMLAFRYMFVICQSAVSLAVYVRLRKYKIASVFSSLIFMIHVPLTFMTMNYNSMGVMIVEIIGLLLFSDGWKREGLKKFILGVFIAASVLCNPIISIVYLLYTLTTAVRIFLRKKEFAEKYLPENIFSGRTWLFVTSGIIPPAAAFFAFLFSRTTLDKFLKNLPMLFTDPEYAFSGEKSNVFTLVESLTDVIKVNVVLFILSAAVFIFIIADKKRKEHRKSILLVSATGYIGYILSIVFSKYFINKSEEFWTTIEEGTYLYWMMPLAFFGLICYILSENKEKRLFLSLWLTGVIYSVCLEISSDLGPISSTMGLAVSNTASAVFVFNIISEIRSEKTHAPEYAKNKKVKRSTAVINAACILSAAAMLLQIGMQIRIMGDIKGVCFEYAVENEEQKLDYKIQKGPAKGLKTTERKYNIYNTMINDLDKIKEKCTDNFLVTDNYPWCYLYMGKNYGTYAEWILGHRWFQNDSARLQSYYNLNPEKIPEYIYVTNRGYNYYYSYLPEQAEKIKDDICSWLECDIQKADDGYILHVLGRKEKS